MPALKNPDNRVFFGKGGTGKTYLALHQLRRFKRVIIHDTAGDPACAEGALVIDDRRELIDRLMIGGDFWICWRGVLRYRKDAFEIANEMAYAAEKVAVFWDEIDRFTTAGDLPEFAYMLAHLGRHREARTFAAARRPAMVPRNLTAVATRICVARTNEPRDLRYLTDYMGEAVNGLPGLADLHFLDWTEAGARVRRSPFA